MLVTRSTDQNTKYLTFGYTGEHRKTIMTLHRDTAKATHEYHKLPFSTFEGTACNKMVVTKSNLKV